MQTGFRGTFVIAWEQTSTDGNPGAAPQSMGIGSPWRWTGQARRVDGPDALLPLADAVGEADLRQRAARRMRKLVGAVGGQTKQEGAIELEQPLSEACFVVTDGRETFQGALIETKGSPPLAMFLDKLPPRDRDLWVVQHRIDADPAAPAKGVEGGVICFTPGTLIRTSDGAVPVETLQPGDKVQTKDNGLQEICWRGARRITGARLHVMPHLTPIRLRHGALGKDVPDADLLVSPEHRMVVRGRAALELFNAPEVLAAAKDLVDGRSIYRDRTVRDVTYIHLLLERHEIIWANGLETESFHPANTSLDMLSDVDRISLLQALPQIGSDPLDYGPYARRNLSASEAAVLSFKAA